MLMPQIELNVQLAITPKIHTHTFSSHTHTHTHTMNRISKSNKIQLTLNIFDEAVWNVNIKSYAIAIWYALLACITYIRCTYAIAMYDD